MSDDDSRARRVGPFVQTVASATWFSAIDGFFSTASSSSTRVGSLTSRSSLPIFSSAYWRICSLTSRFRPFTWSRMGNETYLTARAKVTTSTRLAPALRRAVAAAETVAALGEGEAALACDSRPAAQERHDRQVPAFPQPRGQALRGIVPALHVPDAV